MGRVCSVAEAGQERSARVGATESEGDGTIPRGWITMMLPALTYEQIQALPLSQLLRNRAGVKVGDTVYCGDMANIAVVVQDVDHSKHRESEQYLGSDYRFLDGSLAYYMGHSCRCCRSGHDYLQAVTSNRIYLGRVCTSCGNFESVGS